ncbi:protein LKAAEAR1 isoform X2 [Erinaceus europaeus]|uniref:Protein LKAAEAR1 isoform X2 n=1 Tax=Erinaceus europaeus TaxID=9365 RepID=A0ABM3VRJ6_ERIEU|nr:protein LKAAEAR1 isoform X2 [Erinaceus europaeus]
MLPPVEGGRRAPRQRGGQGAQDGQGAERRPHRPEPSPPGWALQLEELAALSPARLRRHLLFADVLEDVGADDSVFPRESVELGYRVPDPRDWAQPSTQPAYRQDQLLGVLKAAEARGRVRAMRLRYMRMRAEEITLLIQRQKSARAAMRLELFLPPQLKPTRIPDPLDRQERRRVETILEEKVEDSIFPR